MNYLTRRAVIGNAVAFILVCAISFSLSQIVIAQTIEGRLQGKSLHERANIKATQIVNSNPVGAYQSPTYGLTVEIESIAKIEGGVEIFARAWRGGQQLGFGKDGSVEIERFRIFNPPVLVPDPNGEVVREWTDENTGELKRRSLREDPVAAMRADLAHTISIVGKTGTKIVKGKQGNTTSTFYSDAGGDGYAGYINTGSWSTARGGSSPNVVNDTAVNMQIGAEEEPGTTYAVERGFFPFDTSELGDEVTIDSATFTVVRSGGENPQTSGVILTTQADPQDLVGADFQALTLNSPAEGTDSRVDTNVATGSPIAYTLNATGRGWLSKTGWTKLGIRFTGDIDNVTPPNDTRRYVQVYSSDQTGSTEDPKLVVEHTASAPGGVRKSATQTTSSDTTTDNDSELVVSLSESTQYDVHGVIFASSTSQMPDIKVAFTAPSGAEMDIAIIPSSSEEAELLQASNTDSDGIPVPANRPIVIHVAGTIKTGGTSGNLAFQWAQNTSDASAVAVLRGSYLRVDEI